MNSRTLVPSAFAFAALLLATALPAQADAATLTVNKAGNGNGVVDCNTGFGFGPCASSYPPGTTITLRATPDSHSTFVGWSGGGCSGLGDCVLSNVNANTTVTAAFSLIQRSLTLGKTGSGNGFFACDAGSGFGPCASTYSDGTTLTIKAIPDSHSTFTGWSGGGCTGSGDCMITIGANVTIQGAFSLIQRSLTLGKTGSGNGSFECDTGSGFGPCAVSYPEGASITIRATPDSSSTFAGWSEGDCSGSGDCLIAGIGADVEATATFDLTQPPGLQCSDGVDNDGDAYVDFPADPDCVGVNDVSEAAGPVAPTVHPDLPPLGVVDPIPPMCKKGQVLRLGKCGVDEVKRIQELRRKSLARCEKKKGKARARCLKRASRIGKAPRHRAGTRSDSNG